MTPHAEAQKRDWFLASAVPEGQAEVQATVVGGWWVRVLKGRMMAAISGEGDGVGLSLESRIEERANCMVHVAWRGGSSEREVPWEGP